MMGLIGLIIYFYGLYNILYRNKSHSDRRRTRYHGIMQTAVGCVVMCVAFFSFICLASMSFYPKARSAYPSEKSVNVVVGHREPNSVHIHHLRSTHGYYNTSHGIYKYTGLTDSDKLNFVRQPTLQAVIKEKEHTDNAYNSLQPRLNKYSDNLPPTDNDNDD